MVFPRPFHRTEREGEDANLNGLQVHERDLPLRNGWNRVGYTARFQCYPTRIDEMPEARPKKSAEEHRPGEVWKTEDGNWRSKNPEGDSKSFDTKDQAESHAKGGEKEEGPKSEGSSKKMTIEVKGAAMATSEAVKSEQGKGEKILRDTLGEEKANALIENRKKRDGDKAHITLLSPADTKKAISTLAEKEGISKGEAEKRVKALAAQGVPEDFEVKGVGKAEKDGKEAYYAVVDWPAGNEFRKSLGLPSGDEEGAQDFHITLGFGEGGDVHGVRKRDTSVGKKAMSLRSKLIRLAHENPELRPHILPLIKSGSTMYVMPVKTHAVELVQSVQRTGDRSYDTKLALLDLLKSLASFSKMGLKEPQLARLITKAEEHLEGLDLGTGVYEYVPE